MTASLCVEHGKSKLVDPSPIMQCTKSTVAFDLEPDEGAWIVKWPYWQAHNVQIWNGPKAVMIIACLLT